MAVAVVEVNIPSSISTIEVNVPGSITTVEVGASQQPAAEAWHIVGDPGEPTFTSPWQNESGASAITLRYRKHETFVQVLGTIEATSSVNQEASIVSGFLPAGYRPALRLPWGSWPEIVYFETNGDLIFMGRDGFVGTLIINAIFRGDQ